ncbi:MAG: BTAD domain-containing putative transcriptional regulator [Actinomycetota bacterium]
MEFRILGPLEVRDGERAVELGRGRQRALLALLLLHPNEALSSERLVEELWGERAPPTAPKVIQNHVSNLRRSLGDGRLVTRGSGYALTVEKGELDVERFEDLLAEGREALHSGDPGRTADVLRDALKLWRGPALSDFAYESFAQSEIARLEDRRLVALEERIEADLALGRHSDLVAELETLVAEHPTRERLRGQLMLALYRSGRQAEALHAYQETRRTLVDELGIEPGQALQRLHTAILQQDGSLDLAPETRRDSPPPARSRLLPRRSTARLLLAGGILLVAAAATALTVKLTDDSGGASLAAVAGNSIGLIDPQTNQISAQIPVGGTPTSVSVGEGAVWVLNADDETISRIDPETKSVETFGTGTIPTDLAAGAGALWVGNGSSVAGPINPVIATTLSKLDPIRGDPRAKVALPRAEGGVSNLTEDHIAVGAGAVWAINPNSTVSRIDRDARRVATVGEVEAIAIAGDERSVWVLNGDNTFSRINPATNRASKRIRVAATSLTDIAIGAKAVWLADPFDGVVWRIDVVPRVVMRTIDVGEGVDHVAFGQGSLWATNGLRGTLLRIDPATNRVMATIAVGNTPRNLAVGEGAVWVSVAGLPGGGVPAASTPETAGVQALPRSICGPIFYGGEGSPNALIVSDLPLQGGPAFPTLQMSEAIAYVLRQHRFRAGRHRVAYQSCDDSTARQIFDSSKCTANAKEYTGNPDVVGVIGPYNSGCAFDQIPILNRARGGPLAIISPTNSAEDITRPGANAPPDLARRIYPTGKRNYLRVFPTDSAQGAANALLAHRLGLRRVYVLHDGDPLFALPKAIFFRKAARKLGIEILAFRTWDPQESQDRELADEMARSRADGVFLAAGLYERPGGLIRALRARLGSRFAIMAPEFLPIASLFDEVGPAARGIYVSLPGLTTERLPPAGRRFLREFAATQPGRVDATAVYAAQATEVLLSAIARSDGSRESVLRELFATQMKDGILGSFTFSATGDTTSTPITILRAQRGGGPKVVAGYEGSVIDRVIEPSRHLSR